MIIQVNRVGCGLKNHHSMPLEFVCENNLCIKNCQELSCLECCKQYHFNHKEKITALKIFLHQLILSTPPNDYELIKGLIKKFTICANEYELRKHMSQVLLFKKSNSKFPKILDLSCKIQKNNTNLFYNKYEVIKEKPQNNRSQISFINPIINFKNGYGYQLISPFQIKATKTQFCNAIAYPSLSIFAQNIQVNVKINCLTPNWMGIGFCIGEAMFEGESTQHLLLISNGWLFEWGSFKKSNIYYKCGDKIRIRWNKNLQKGQFKVGNHTCASQLPYKWNQNIHLFVVLYYQNDQVSIIA